MNDDVILHISYSQFEEYLKQLGYVKVIRCKDCKKWDVSDELFKDGDGKIWYHCEELEPYMTNSDDAFTREDNYCSNAERKEE